MAIQFACKCGKHFQAKQEQAGKKARCLGCGNLVIIPRPGAVPLPPMVMADTIKGESCADCGEMFMPHRIVEDEGELVCRPCWAQRRESVGIAVGRHVAPRRETTDRPKSNLSVWLGLGAGCVALIALTVLLILR